LTKAAKLGDADGQYHLSLLYRDGHGAEKDETKKMFLLEEAAIAGYPQARFNLGCIESRNGRVDRSVKHFTIAANLGYDESIKALKDCYRDGEISKEDFAVARKLACVLNIRNPPRSSHPHPVPCVYDVYAYDLVIIGALVIFYA
jgi:TPR repeat protein